MTALTPAALYSYLITPADDFIPREWIKDCRHWSGSEVFDADCGDTYRSIGLASFVKIALSMRMDTIRDPVEPARDDLIDGVSWGCLLDTYDRIHDLDYQVAVCEMLFNDLKELVDDDRANREFEERA